MNRVETTFWTDFTIADLFGCDGIEDTFNRAFNEWKDNYKYLTELVMVLNHKIWFWYESNQNFARVYNDCWMKAHDYALDHLKGDELTFYLKVVD